MSIMISTTVLLALASLGSGLISHPNFAADVNRIQNLQADSIAVVARDAVPAGYVAAPYYPTPPGGVSAFACVLSPRPIIMTYFGSSVSSNWDQR